jgi:hypothetical protein
MFATSCPLEAEVIWLKEERKAVGDTGAIDYALSEFPLICIKTKLCNTDLLISL